DLGQTGQGEVLIGPDRSAPVQWQVQGDTAPLVLQLTDDVAPQQPPGAHAVHEQRRPAGAAVHVSHPAGPGFDHLTVAVVLRPVHPCPSFRVDAKQSWPACGSYENPTAVRY